MTRYHRILSPTKLYHVMIRGNEKNNIFVDDEDRYRFIETLKVKKTENDFELYAYCLMDNHVHLLLNEKDQSIARIMKCICVSYAMYFNKKYRRVGHLFQDRFKSEVIDSDAYLLAAINYIHRNPVKANMVKEAGEYLWSSYKDYVNNKMISCLSDADFIFRMLSDDRNRAVRKLIEISSNQYKADFLDIEDDAEINTRQEAEEFVKQHLASSGLIYDEIKQQKGWINGIDKQELVKMLRSKSNLGSRELGSLLGMGKSTINKLLRG